MGKKHRLSSEEIEKVVSRIRAKYDDYIIRYLKPPSIRYGFEDRYLDVLRSGTDPESFLYAEISVVDELIRREENNNSFGTGKNRKQDGGKNRGAKKESFADRVMAEHRKLIEKYPDAKLPPGSTFEIKKLFGMLMHFDREIWPLVTKFFGNSRLPLPYDERNRLETEEMELCVSRKEGIPPALTRYEILQSRPEKNWEEIELEEKNLILRASFFLHRIKNLCRSWTGTGHLSEEEKKRVEKILIFLHSVIEDFRLFDLKPNE